MITAEVIDLLQKPFKPYKESIVSGRLVLYEYTNIVNIRHKFAVTFMLDDGFCGRSREFAYTINHQDVFHAFKETSRICLTSN